MNSLLVALGYMIMLIQSDVHGCDIKRKSENLNVADSLGYENRRIPADIGVSTHNCDESIVIFAVYDSINNTPLIPQDIFKRPPCKLVLVDPLDTMSVKSEDKTRYEIIWPAPSIDGTLELVITRAQVWLRSGHENPNPNELFWFTAIDEKQYSEIVKAIKTMQKDFEEIVPESGFSRFLYWQKYIPELPLPSEWSDEDIRIHREDFREKRYMNAKKLIDVINGMLDAEERVEFPSRLELDNIPAVRLETSL